MSAQKIEAGIVAGSVIKVERSSGSFKAQDGADVLYDFTEVKVLSADADVSILRVPHDNQGRPLHALPSKGDVVAAQVEYRAAQGNVKATVQAWLSSEVVDALVLVPA